jgi:drug/metabolite transporter (DMT)-like permease
MFGAACGALPAALAEAVTVPETSHGIAYLAAYGVLTYVGYVLYNSALAKLPTTLVAIAGYGQPVIATALAAILLSEIPSAISLAGGVVVMAGLLLATVGENHEKTSVPQPEP